MAELLLQLVALLFLASAANAARRVSADTRRIEDTGEAIRDKVTDPLPGFNPGENLSFDHYAGYVTVNKTAGRALFYWFVEAADDSSSKPLVLWLNGGPGCSSVGYGAMQEIGPFHLDNSEVVLNPYSWNKVANLLFLESPAGVGFSYSNTSSDLQTGDSRTTSDSYIFLVNWLERFPEYKNREFYITGESYAGVYVPLLAKLIYEKNKDVESKSVINLKGFMVGNAVMDDLFDILGEIDFWFTHALISHQTHDSLIQACILGDGTEENQKRCDALLDHAIGNEFGLVDPYNIYAEICSTQQQARTPLHLAWRGIRRLRSYDPCIENHVSVYLNKPEVQRVLHANTTGNILRPWSGCSETIDFKLEVTTVLPVYRELLQAGLRIWVYSGDVDAVVPVTSTRYALEKLNLTIVTPWYPWYRDQQVGGHSEVYEGLTFVIVRGAGHEVPMFQPARAFSLIQAFLEGTEMPKQAQGGVSDL